MDKSAVKKFAVWANKELNKNSEKDQLQEKHACSWFLRLCALYYMEANGYMRPCKKDRESIIARCNELSGYLPMMFERKGDPSERYFPENEIFGRQGFYFRIEETGKESWKNNIQILGWMYQFYNSAKKDEIFEALKNNVKISRENIPAATQLFTPDWIVKYMVENSLGRLWVNGHTNTEKLKRSWDYYLEEPEQNTGAGEQAEVMEKSSESMSPETIRCIDPCCGSGHVLVYLFDVLMQIYQEQGHTEKEAAKSIIRYNLHGLDIDETAASLASFSLIMKACQYDKNFLKENLKPNVYSVKGGSRFDRKTLEAFADGDEKLRSEMAAVISDMADAEEYGSLIKTECRDRKLLRERLTQVRAEKSMDEETVAELENFIRTAELLSGKFHVVVTNPPYMGRKSLNEKMSRYIEEHYRKGKSELYSAFMLRCIDMTEDHGFTAMVTMHSWMFISSYEQVRREVLDHTDIISMMHTGAATFEELNAFNALAVSFVLRKKRTEKFISTFMRLAEIYDPEEKIGSFGKKQYLYYSDQTEFEYIPGCPLVYWISDRMRENFVKSRHLRDYYRPKQGLATGDNKKYVRYWHEVPYNEIGFGCADEQQSVESGCKWFPYNKGGKFRKWYGMNEYVVNWENGGEEIRNFYENGKLRSRPQNTKDYFKEGITWSLFGFENFAVRYKPKGFVFDVSGSSLFPDNDRMLYILAFLAGKVAFAYLSVLAPTVNFQVGNIGDLPLIISEENIAYISKLAEENIRISRQDWDSYEVSWDFEKDPLLKYGCSSVEEAYHLWKEECEQRYCQLKKNEESLNEAFIRIYGLEHEMTAEVLERDVSVYRIYDRKSDIPEYMKTSAYVLTKKDVIKNLVSYGIGCIAGRFSLLREGIVSTEVHYELGNAQILAERWKAFLASAFGGKMFEENLAFVEDSLGKSIDKYLEKDFYADHLQKYHKKPLYHWDR